MTTIAPNVTEASFQRTVIDLARWHKWRVFHARPARRQSGGFSTPMTGDVGFPDLALARAGVVIIAELKVAKGRLTDGQRAWLAELGVYGRVWRPADMASIVQELRDGPKETIGQ